MNLPAGHDDADTTDDEEEKTNWWIVLSTPSKNPCGHKTEDHGSKRRWWQKCLSKLSEVKLSDWLMIIFTATIAFYARLQWHEMQGAGQQTGNLVTYARHQSEAASNFAQTASSVENTDTHTERDLQTMADSSKGSIQATQNAMRLDQRAWLVFKSIQGVPTLNQPLAFTVGFLNAGKTPAKDVRFSCNYQVRQSESQVTFKEVPYNKTGFIAPNDPNNFCDTEPIGIKVPLDQTALDVLKGGQLTVFLFGSATYTDVFAKPHWLTFCHVLRQDLVSWETCANHKDDTGDGDYTQP